MKKLIYRHGVMDCGKIALLLQVAYNYEKKGMKVRVLKPTLDTKGEDEVVSRIEGLHRKVDYLINNTEELKDYLSKLYEDNISCVLVDEAQFLNNEQISELYYFTKKYNIPVICYGLRADFRGILFEGSASLFALADTIEELITICECGRKARFNARIENGEYVSDGKQIIIDGESDVKYEGLCGLCYLKKVLHKNLELIWYYQD